MFTEITELDHLEFGQLHLHVPADPWELVTEQQRVVALVWLKRTSQSRQSSHQIKQQLQTNN